MSPTYTMSAHLCKEIYSSWRKAHPAGSDPLPSPPTTASYLQRSPSPEKRSLDSDRSSDLSSSPPARGPATWRWGNRSGPNSDSSH
ncbi:hypothetical protein V8F33_002002 [Rhypophila sp. PSN 637]